MSGGICPGECPGPTRGVSRNAFYESTILTYLLLRGTTLRHNVGTTVLLHVYCKNNIR